MIAFVDVEAFIPLEIEYARDTNIFTKKFINY